MQEKYTWIHQILCDECGTSYEVVRCLDNQTGNECYICEDCYDKSIGIEEEEE